MATSLKTGCQEFTFGTIFSYFSQIDFVQYFEVILILKQLLRQPSDMSLIEIIRSDYFSQELDFVAANPVHVEFIVSTEVLLSSKSTSIRKRGKPFSLTLFSMLESLL